MNTRAPCIPADYHTHTVLCHHADGLPLDYVIVAAQKGVPEIASTDHSPAPEGYDPKHRMSIEQFDVYRTWVREAARTRICPMILGVEADYFAGCEKFFGSWLPLQPLDLVLGSIHYLEPSGTASRRADEADSALWDSADVNAVWRQYFELVGRLADTRFYDVVAHFDLPKRNGDRPDPNDLRDLVLPALDRIAKAGMSIEINTAGLRHPVHELYPSTEILSWAHERGISITFGSDAHSPANIAADFDLAVQAALEAGYTECARYRRRQKEMVPLQD